jgi:hypothetical protein
MRSPGPAFDLRGAMAHEVRTAIEALEQTGADPNAVHRCRVRLKRARALARIGHSCAPGLSSVFNDSARGVMALLAHSRDAAALAEAARDAAKHAKKKSADALRAAAAALTARAHAPEIDLATANSGLKDLLALAQVWPEASARQVRKGARRLVRRARKGYKKGRLETEITRRHEWRKREKDRLYGATLLDEAWPAPRRKKLGDQLGEALGSERDAVLLIARLRTDPKLAGDNKAPRRAVKALRKRRKHLAAQANALGARLHASGA